MAPQSPTASLLTQDSAKLEKIAFELAHLLAQIPFERVLKAKLNRAQEALEKEEITPAEYLQKPLLAQAREILENEKRAQNLFGSFSTYQKFCLMMAAVTFVVAIPFIRDIFVLLFSGKPALEETGDNNRYYCTTGLTDKVVDVCGNLMDGATAIFSMMPGTTAGQPAYLGLTNQTPAIEPATVSQWVLPLQTGWVNYFTCGRDGNFTQLEGNGFFGSAQGAIQKASNGFPVARALITKNADPIINFIEFGLAMSGFLIEYCEKIQYGFYSAFQNPNNNYQDYGPTQGIEQGGKDLEHSGYAIGGAMAGMLGMTFIAAFFIVAKRLCERWDAKQKVVGACNLFKESDALIDTSNSSATVLLREANTPTKRQC